MDKEQILKEMNRIEVLYNMLVENVDKFDDEKMFWSRDFNCSKTSILNQIRILRTELLYLAKMFKEI